MNDKKTSQNRQKKEKIVAELKEKVEKSKGMVFTSYQGLTHKQLEDIKKAVRTMNADFVATKNTLLKIALGENQSKIISDLKNATATLFLYADPVLPLKELAKSIKALGLPIIKLGILDGEELTSDQLIKISSLPSREALLTKLVGSLKSPIYGLHRSLSWNMQKLVMTLKAIETKKI